MLLIVLQKQKVFKSGVYSGNNSTNGPFINTGFEPALVIVKRYGANGYNWAMLDNKRSSAQGFNPNDKFYMLM